MTLAPEYQRTLLETARQAIDYGLEHSRAPALSLSAYPDALCRLQASFVTLKLRGRLRGCMGALAPQQPLISDVSKHSFMAAFSDPRFSPVNHTELIELDISVSVLSSRSPIVFQSEPELIEQLRPNMDGLIIAKGKKRATFLPSVWQSLPEPVEFLAQLKQKAKLAADTEDYQAWRYTAQSVEEPLKS